MLLSINRGKPPLLSSFLLVNYHVPAGFSLVHLRAIDCVQKSQFKSTCLVLATAQPCLFLGQSKLDNSSNSSILGRNKRSLALEKAPQRQNLMWGKFIRKKLMGRQQALASPFQKRNMHCRLPFFLFLFKRSSL